VGEPIKHRNIALLIKVGSRIRDLRLQKGLSQMEFANRCDVELSTINRIELGKASPSLTLLFIMAKELKVTASELINFKL
jgi:putative transcriptional regulator